MLESRGNMNKNDDFEKLIVTTDSFDDIKNLDSEIKKRDEGFVPFEVYPYDNYIYVGYVHTDSKFKKADIGELISILDNIIENEYTHFKESHKE